MDKYRESTEILKLAMSYYVQTSDYEEAKELARTLLDKGHSAENYVIYTDVIAQEAYAAPREDSSDPEKQTLIDKARKLEEKAEKYDDGEEKKEKLLNEAEELYQEAANVDIRRAINFLEAKRPLIFDDTGLYDLQLAKLYLLADEREKAQSWCIRLWTAQLCCLTVRR